MAALSGSPPKHTSVPAWKRLGLKLKYAKEDVSDPSLEQTHEQSRPLAAFTNDDGSTPATVKEAPSKKRKRSSDVLIDSESGAGKGVPASSIPSSHQIAPTDRGTPAAHEQVIDGQQFPGAEDHDIPQSVPAVADPAVSSADATIRPRRKSVTFTPDTKTQDGFATPSTTENPTDERDLRPSAKKTKVKGPKTESGDVEATLPSHKPEANNESQSHRSKTNNDQDPDSVDSMPGYVTYLQLFHTDKPSWKFSKKKQNDLLKNLFNLNRIPEDLNEALLHYISGLQGSGPKQRIVDDAQAVLKEIYEKHSDPEERSDMESEQARRAAYRAALMRNIQLHAKAGFEPNEYNDQQIEEMRREAERGKRAEAILAEVLGKDLHPESSQTTKSQEQTARDVAESNMPTAPAVSTPINGQPPLKATSNRKKRKQRTQAIQIDSDSENENGFTKQRKDPAEGGRAEKSVSRNAVPSKPMGTHKVFDDDLLDRMFPKGGRR